MVMLRTDGDLRRRQHKQRNLWAYLICSLGAGAWLYFAESKVIP